MELSPPYGDGIAYTHLDSGLLTFSPPCGDGILINNEFVKSAEFSPPCGDRTEIAAYKALTA